MKTMTKDQEALRRGLEYNKPQGFDTRVEIFDPKTGVMVAYNPYSLTCEKAGAGATKQIFERDGIKYWPDGSLVEETAEKGKKATHASAS